MNSGPLPPGTKLGKYLVVRVIGTGGMGAVYEGAHLELRKRVAIKTLLPALAANPEARARFLREGEAASRIDHPNVVNVTDIGVGGDIPFLVMEYLDGENLAQRQARDGALSTSVLLDLLLPIMDALARGHDEGVVHRDLKPHNIFLARGGDGRLIPKLLDYGVSKIVGDDRGGPLTGSLAVLGTAQYMAPEQIDGPKDVDARTDQYAMGLVLFECAAGRPARQGSSPLAMLKAVANEEVPSLRQLRPDLDPGFEAVVSRALQFHPAARFSSMRALMAALLPFARPQTRAHWAEALAGRVDSASAATDATSFPPTLRLPEATTAPEAPSTTFRSTAGQVVSLRSPRRGRTWALVFTLALLAGGTYLVADGQLLTGKGGSGERAASAPKPEPAAVSQPTRPPIVRRTVEIRTTPPGATARVDGLVVGTSPLTTEVSPGAHELVVSAPGFRPVTLELAEATPLPPLIELAPEAAPPRAHKPAPRPRPKPAPHRPAKAPARAEPTEETVRPGVNDSIIIQ